MAPAAPAAAAAAAAIGDGLDMFADNVDADMFAEDPGAPVGVAPAKKALLDNYDDVEGYYNFQVGFLLLLLSELASVVWSPDIEDIAVTAVGACLCAAITTQLLMCLAPVSHCPEAAFLLVHVDDFTHANLGCALFVAA